MKVLLANDKYGQKGASSFLVAQARAGLQARGHDVRVLTTHRTGEPNPHEGDPGVTSVPVSYRPSLRPYLSLWNPAVNGPIADALDGFRPDVVHAHNVHTYLTYNLLGLARKRTGKVFISLHDVMSFAYRRLNTARFLDSGGDDCRVTMADQIAAAGITWNPLRNACIRKALGNAAKVLPVSAALEKALHQNGIGNTRVLRNAIDVRRWAEQRPTVGAFAKKHGLEGRRVILFGGRLSEDKGIREVLAALDVVRHAVPDALLLVIGEKERYDEYAARDRNAQDLSASIRCTGWLGEDDMRDAFRAADVVTTPSLCLDTFNMMNLEAQASGTPVVGTRFGGTPEVIDHGNTGYVCDPRDTETYAGYLLDLLQRPEKARRFGEAGQARARELFDVERHLDDLETIYA